jgi:hypothetical protein
MIRYLMSHPFLNSNAPFISCRRKYIEMEVLFNEGKSRVKQPLIEYFYDVKL